MEVGQGQNWGCSAQKKKKKKEKENVTLSSRRFGLNHLFQPAEDSGEICHFCINACPFEEVLQKYKEEDATCQSLV
jgi:hypothetical protein